MQKLTQNLRYGLRMLRKNPGLTVAVIATLAIGIGATTAIYTVVYATLLAPLPFPQPDQLVIVWSKINGHNNPMSAGDFLDWQKQNHTFSHMSAITGGTFNVAEKGQPELINGRRAGTLPDEANLQLDPAVLAVAVGATTLAGLLFGCLDHRRVLAGPCSPGRSGIGDPQFLEPHAD